MPRPRPPGADRPNDSLGVDDAALVLGEHAAIASRRLADCAWRAELIEARSPAAGLAAAARHHRATAIVVGSHRRGGGHTVLGNQLHELPAVADAPIVVVPLAPSIATTTTTARVPPGRGRPSASARSDRV